MAKKPTRSELEAKLDTVEGLIRQALGTVVITTTEAKDGSVTHDCRPLFLDCAGCKEDFWSAMSGLSLLFPGATSTGDQEPEAPAEDTGHHDDDHPHPHE